MKEELIMKKVLVIGGTGVMGSYLIPFLVAQGFQTDVVALDSKYSANANLRYIQGDAKNDTFLSSLLCRGYDAIVDFMTYGTDEFLKKHTQLLANTDQYIFLSSYRVYANEEHPIVETSPRLLETSKDKEFLASDDYSLFKAREEDILKNSGKSNWTIVRPTITYSPARLQLVTLEPDTLINRARLGKPVILPQQALDAQTTMTWGSDVAKMLARLVLNKDAYGEAFTTATAEHHSWKEVAKYYEKLLGLKYIAVDKEDFLTIRQDELITHCRWQLEYDRCFERIIDNRKILNVTGIKQSELIGLYDGLKHTIEAIPADKVFGTMNYSKRMDWYLETNNLI